MSRVSLSIRAKLFLVLGILGFLLLKIAAGGWIGTYSMHASIGTIYADRVVPLRDLKVVSDLYAVNIVDTSHKVRDGTMPWSEGLTNVDAARSEIKRRWSAYTATYMDATEKALAGEAERLMRNADEAVDRLRGILRSQDRPALGTFTTSALYAAIDPVSEALGKLVDLQLDVAKSEAGKADATYTLLRLAFTAATVAALAALAWAAYAIVAGISRPLGRIAVQMTGLARGDLGVVVTDAAKRDEIGTLARALEVFKEALLAKKRADEAMAAENEAKVRRAQRLDDLTKRFEANAIALVKGLSGAATEMEATAHSMTSIADQTTRRSVEVAGAAEQTSANVQTVSAATEELSISIREITGQVAQSAGIAGRAVERARRTDETVQALSRDAARIGDVVALINDIAGQTNLLALNATIEAARAGEAGRGFAVVAAEVKALAGQTTKATEEIAAQIASIQGTTDEAVASVREIGAVIAELSAIASSVAAAVEEQGAATQEIARSVQEAAGGTEQVRGSILSVRDGAGETGAAASQVLGAARGVAEQSSELGREVASFLSDVRIA
jgi:methyl-accepting chemotaxis protein